jgi:hypothetical protein
MKELWLKYVNENGETRKILVKGERFTIGRQPDNDLFVSRSELSRHHAEIDRFDDAYILSDNNSSNGTTVNGIAVMGPITLKNGDTINFGGGLAVEAELVSADSELQDVEPADSTSETAAQAGFGEQPPAASQAPESEAAPEVVNSPNKPASPAAPEKSFFSCFFIVAPILVVVILLCGGGLLLITGVGKNNNSLNSKNDDIGYLDDDRPRRNSKDENSKETPTPSSKNTNTNSLVNSSSTPANTGNQTLANASISSESDKVERNAYSFLRRIAKADQNPVLTSKQIDLVNAKIKSVRSSSALQGNLQDLKKKSGELDALAKSKSLRPQFLAAAALAQLGSNRGDPLATAQSMGSALNQLSNLISNDLASDSLMIIAAYQEDATGKSGMPGMLANLTNKFPNESPQKIRTIWFLRDNNKITESQFEFALRFLAIGTIMQNPKEFNVQTDAVIFN